MQALNLKIPESVKTNLDIYKDMDSLPKSAKDCVVAIGNFDGVHKGHKKLLEKASEIAKTGGKRLAVMTFEPHPRSLFRPDDPPFRITPQSYKLRLLEQNGVNVVFTINFDWDFASMSGEDFVEKFLIDKIGAFHVIVGKDFRFGQLRFSNPQVISKPGIPLTVIDLSSDNELHKYSSSDIRICLRNGDIEKANEILGHKWQITGRVIHGDKRGRKLGFPTANMRLDDILHPAYGVYASWTKIYGFKMDEDNLLFKGDYDGWFPSVTNIGIRPMFELPVGQSETYIFGFDEDIYGMVVSVMPVQRIRGEARFPDIETLVKQMKKDCEDAREILCV